MNVGRRMVALGAILALGFIGVTGDGRADGTATVPFSQDWSNTGLITTNNNWSGVLGVVGFRGDAMVTGTGVDPQTVLADGSSTPVSVLANQTNPNTNTTGAV